MEQQASVGAIIGCGVCVVASWGSSPLVVSLAAIAGFSMGSVIGVFLGFASVDLPDEPVVAPQLGDERPERHETGRRTRRACPGRRPIAAPRMLRVAENLTFRRRFLPAPKRRDRR